jgi:hypothetical protein
MPVSSHVARGVDFTPYVTYDWAPPDALPVTDGRLGRNPFFADHLQGAIDLELRRRGLMRATESRAGLLVHYHAAVTERLEVASRPRQFRDCVGDDCRPQVNRYEAGTLVIDIVDASTRQLVWRGWAEHRFEDMLDDPDQVSQRIRTAVRGIFEAFPMTVNAGLRRTALEGTR